MPISLFSETVQKIKLQSTRHFLVCCVCNISNINNALVWAPRNGAHLFLLSCSSVTADSCSSANTPLAGYSQSGCEEAAIHRSVFGGTLVRLLVSASVQIHTFYKAWEFRRTNFCDQTGCKKKKTFNFNTFLRSFHERERVSRTSDGMVRGSLSLNTARAQQLYPD